MPGRYDVSFLASLSEGSVLQTTTRRSPKKGSVSQAEIMSSASAFSSTCRFRSHVASSSDEVRLLRALSFTNSSSPCKAYAPFSEPVFMLLKKVI